MTEPVVAVVGARRDQLLGVQRLAREIWHAHYPGIITVEQIDYMLARGYALEALARFLDGPGRGLELAIVDGEIVGFAAWCLTEEPRTAKLDKLYVLQSRQRLGLGRRLIACVEERARAAGAATLILNVNKRNVQAIAAYGKHGFAVREAVVVDIGSGWVMDDYVMTRSIARVD